MTERKIYVTLDTEMDSDIHWKKFYPPQYSSVLQGIPQLLRPIWDKYNVHPIYFVSPEVLYDENCVAILRQEVDKGAVIGAHLHPEYILPDSIWGDGMELVVPKFPCYGYSDEIEEEKLANLTDLIEEKIGIRPIWYRAARFGADEETIAILQRLGYKYDSSITPYINWRNKGGPNHSKSLNRPYFIKDKTIYTEDRDNRNGIQEYPVTIMGKRLGFLGKFLPDNWLFYSWLRPTQMTLIELKSIINRMVLENIQEGVMMFHSMEIMINKTPYVRNKWMQNYYLWRLDKALAYAAKKGYRL